MKTCNFCNDECAQKNLRDQIIERHMAFPATTARKLAILPKSAEANQPRNPTDLIPQPQQMCYWPLTQCCPISIMSPQLILPQVLASTSLPPMAPLLPNSGADISAAGRGILRLLNEKISNLLPSNIIPKVANGATMHPLGKIPVTFKLKNREYTDDLHIYSSVHGLASVQRTWHITPLLPRSCCRGCNTLIQRFATTGTQCNNHATQQRIYSEGVPHSFWWQYQKHGWRGVPYTLDRWCKALLCQHTKIHSANWLQNLNCYKHNT